MAVPGVKQASSGWSIQGMTNAGSTLQPAKNTVQTTAPATTLQNTYNPQPDSYNPQAYSAPVAFTSDPYQPPAAPYVPPDPYARWGGYAGYKAAEDNYNQTKNLTYSSITDSINDTVAGTKSSILDFLTSYDQQQGAINKQSKRNELAREEKRVGILDMIGQGLRNGQVTLNNANATSSSAAEQIAKAYSRMGQKQMMSANKDYNLGKEDINDIQSALGTSLETFRRKYGEDKTSAANKIVQGAVSALSSLNSMAAGNGVGGGINVEAEKARILGEASASLNALDTVFNEGVAKVKPTTREQNRADAHKLLYGDYVPENALGFETTLPIYTLG